MKSLSRVVWSEGMYLGPHHFQAQNRYFEDSSVFLRSTLWYEPFGVTSCSMSTDALRNGTVSVLQASGIFPDGLPFDMPECDLLPAARNISEIFPVTRNSVTVCLGIPPYRRGGRNCALDSETVGDQRFVGAFEVFHDETSGDDEKQVRLGRKNISLILDIEPADDLLTLPIVRVVRDSSGHLVYDSVFVPPCLRLDASKRLMAMLVQLIEILEEKSTSLAKNRSRDNKFQAGMSSTEVASYWLLHTINSSLTPLRHLYFSKRGHPEELFREMLRLGGALCTFGLDTHPRNLPAYDHLHLDQCFEELNAHIRRHLEIVLPSQAISIPLQRTVPYFYEGTIADQRCLDRSRWILGIRSPMGESDLILKTPQLVKFCSAKFVPELVKRALPGLTLSHLSIAPSAMISKVEMQYFSVSKAGPCWEHIVQTRNIGLYVPGEFSPEELEVVVVLES